MKYPLFLLTLLSAVIPGFGQQLGGTWKGRFDKIPLSIVLRIRPDTAHAGRFTGDWDSPDQGGFNFPIGSIDTGDSILFSLPTIGGQYRARLTHDSLKGVWLQAGNRISLDLNRTDTSVLAAAPKRPQLPEKPYPYREEEIIFRNSDSSIQYGATLTIPRNAHRFPAVVLITGSGQEDRDETIFGHKPFLVIADYLSRRGIAVLRVDDRGVGKTTGEVQHATTADFAKDVTAAVQYLRSRPEIDKARIGLAGHSEGGLIAPMVAAQTKDIAFIILLAGPGLKGSDVLKSQIRKGITAMGVNDTTANAFVDLNSRMVDMALQPLEKNDLEERAQAMFREWRGKQSPRTLRALNLGKDELSEQYLNATMRPLQLPWMRYFLMYDPAPALRKVKCPVLALNGGKDWQVDATRNLPAIKQALEAGGNKQYEIKELPGLNHLFQTAKTGAPSEYVQIEETFSPEALQIMADWIRKVTKQSRLQ
jgi:pimeloyl-ACP methyl ester carboxylesterase